MGRAFAAIALTILALVHAELGAMYPVAGGTARFPHYAFGTLAGASFGWFSWLQAATVALIAIPDPIVTVRCDGSSVAAASMMLPVWSFQHSLPVDVRA